MYELGGYSDYYDKIYQYSIETATLDIGFGIAPNDFQQFVGLGTNDFTFRQGGYNGTELMRIKGTGNVGIGTTTPKNKLDVEGGAVIGATYSGTNTAPSNGLLVEGNVGIGTTTPQNKLNVVGNVNATSGFVVGANTGLTGNYSIGDCWMAYSGGIMYSTNCTAY